MRLDRTRWIVHSVRSSASRSREFEARHDSAGGPRLDEVGRLSWEVPRFRGDPIMNQHLGHEFGWASWAPLRSVARSSRSGPR